MKNFVLVLLLFLTRIVFIAPYALFFDGPEYERLIMHNNLLSALTFGHEPIHPGFILPSWLVFRTVGPLFAVSSVIAGEVVAVVASVISLFVFYKITEIYFSKKIALRAVIIASLLPVFFLSSVNLLNDTTYICFYLLAFYFLSGFILNRRKKEYFWGFICLSYSVFTHTQILLWLPLFFLPIIFVQKSKRKGVLKKIILFLFCGAGFGIFSLILLLAFTGSSFSHSIELLFMHGGDIMMSPDAIQTGGRFARNLVIILLRNNSSIVILYAFIGLIYLFKYDKKRLAFCLVWILPVLIASQYWHIGLFGRVSLIASFPIALLSAHVKSRIAFVFLVFCLLIFTVPLAIENSMSTLHKRVRQLYSEIPKDSVLISSNLIRPQVTFRGEKYFINEPGQDIAFIKQKINSALLNNKKVFIDSQAVYNPYYSLDGNRLHILSLGKVGNTKVRELFKTYTVTISHDVNPEKRVFLYQINGLVKRNRKNIYGETAPGKEVIIYSQNIFSKVSPLRMDYGDIGVWIYYFSMNKTDALGWTIGDKRGKYEFPKIELNGKYYLQ